MHELAVYPTIPLVVWTMEGFRVFRATAVGAATAFHACVERSRRHVIEGTDGLSYVGCSASYFFYLIFLQNT